MRTLVVADPCQGRARVCGGRMHARSEQDPPHWARTDRGVGLRVVRGASFST
jgi:hypothetical protein